jgi:hypothetical protein
MLGHVSHAKKLGCSGEAMRGCAGRLALRHQELQSFEVDREFIDVVKDVRGRGKGNCNPQL